MRCGGGGGVGAKYLHTQTLGAGQGGAGREGALAAEKRTFGSCQVAKWPSSNLSQVIRLGRQFFAPATILLIINASLKCSGGFIIANEAATQLRNLKTSCTANKVLALILWT